MVDNISIYTNKDGRTRVYLKGSKRVISYPRYIMETELGRPSDKMEQVHHIDDNPLNNDISNLEIKNIGEHQREHSTKYFDKVVICPWCGKEFIWTGIQQRYHNQNRNRITTSEPFCSKKCIGKYWAMIRNRNK